MTVYRNGVGIAFVRGPVLADFLTAKRDILGDALKVGCKPADAPAGGVPFIDGSRTQASDYRSAFPYLNTPLPGAKNL